MRDELRLLRPRLPGEVDRHLLVERRYGQVVDDAIQSNARGYDTRKDKRSDRHAKKQSGKQFSAYIIAALFAWLAAVAKASLVRVSKPTITSYIACSISANPLNAIALQTKSKRESMRVG